MTRCNGNQYPGAWTGFQCALDAGHAGKCRPYTPPTVDEWRAMLAMLDELRGMLATVTALAEEDGRDVDTEVVAGVRSARR